MGWIKGNTESRLFSYNNTSHCRCTVTTNRLEETRWSSMLRTIDEDVQPQNFGVHTAWRKARDRDTRQHVVSTATLCYRSTKEYYYTTKKNMSQVAIENMTTVMYPVNSAKSTGTNDGSTPQFRLFDEAQHSHVGLGVTGRQRLLSTIQTIYTPQWITRRTCSTVTARCTHTTLTPRARAHRTTYRAVTDSQWLK